MVRRKRAVLFSWIFAVCVLVALIDVFLRIAPESTPVSRGAKTAGIYSCLGCHGTGDPALPEDWSLNCNKENGLFKHPKYTDQCEDVLAFFSAVRVRNTFPERVNSAEPNRLLAGERLARTSYCFQCHGELGQGGFPNKGALKGYIPGYFGKDFRYLTNGGSPIAVKEWIKSGSNQKLSDHFIVGPIANYFFEHQSIKMPKFNTLSNSEIELLVNYVLTLQAFGPMDANKIETYYQLTLQ